MNLEVANKLLALRKKHNLSQEELAEKMGVSRQAVSKWERGEASPDTDNLIQLSDLYRVSLDELLGIDVKTNLKYPHSSSDINATTIRLTKSEDDEFEYFNSKKVTYPKESLKEEIYPNKHVHEQSPQDFQSTIEENESTMNSTYHQSNPIATIPKDGFKKKPKRKSFFKKDRRKNNSPPPFTNNRFINWFERMMKKFKISYKGLYSFPIYAIGIALAIITGDWGQYNDGCFSASAILGIPLYYTLINAIQKRNPNRFGYPILAIIFMLISIGIGFDEELSALWLATIPFYYWFINKDR